MRNVNNNAALLYLTSKTALISLHAAHRDVLSLTGNPPEAKWQIPQQGVEKEICHTV